MNWAHYLGARRKTRTDAGTSAAEVVRVHYDDVYRFCARRVGVDAAEDLAQQTFLVYQREARRAPEGEGLRGWLLGVAHNECRNYWRKRRREAPAEFLWTEPAPSPETGILDRQLLRQALDKLSPEHREVVVLHEVEGMTYAEIAALIKVSEGTVKSRLHHAMQHLRRTLCGGNP